jgi:hypothetical protein
LISQPTLLAGLGPCRRHGLVSKTIIMLDA